MTKEPTRTIHIICPDSLKKELADFNKITGIPKRKAAALFLEIAIDNYLNNASNITDIKKCNNNPNVDKNDVNDENPPEYLPVKVKEYVVTESRKIAKKNNIPYQLFYCYAIHFEIKKYNHLIKDIKNINKNEPMSNLQKKVKVNVSPQIKNFLLYQIGADSLDRSNIYSFSEIVNFFLLKGYLHYLEETSNFKDSN